MAHAGAHEHTSHPPTSLGLNNRKLGMWAFLSSEVMFFTALIVTYLVMEGRNLAMGGPPAHAYFNLYLVSALAFVLLMSSVTMVLAVAATERNDRRMEQIWLASTIVLGLIFLGGQVYEFDKMFSEKFVTVSITEQNGETKLVGIVEHDLEKELPKLQKEHPGATFTESAPKPTTWTTSLFGSTFFTLTGFHGTHVGIGVIWLAVVLVMSLRGHISSRNSLTLEMVGLYWHFVDLVWVFIFALFYLW